MRTSRRAVMLLSVGACIGAMAAGALFLLLEVPVAGQRADVRVGAYTARTSDGKPNLTGLWQAMTTAYVDLEDHPAEPAPFFQLGAVGATPMGQGIIEGQQIPYQPWAAERQAHNRRNRWTLDPEVRCYLPGVPRAMYMPYPFQIVHGTNDILMAFPFASADRVVHMAKRVQPAVDTWMGSSNGRWDGDTLVIDVTGFNDATWFDRAGNFHSEQLEVTERITPIDANALRYEVTIQDAKVFTRPWSMRTVLYRHLDEDLQFQEFKCVPFAEELIYGYLRRYPRETARRAPLEATSLMGCVTGGNLQPAQQPLVFEPTEPFVLVDVVTRTDVTAFAPSDYRVTGIDMTPWLGLRVRVEGTLVPAPATGAVAGVSILPEIRATAVSSIWGTCPSSPAWMPPGGR